VLTVVDHGQARKLVNTLCIVGIALGVTTGGAATLLVTGENLLDAGPIICRPVRKYLMLDQSIVGQ
jgi:hypothetical protein